MPRKNAPQKKIVPGAPPISRLGLPYSSQLGLAYSSQLECMSHSIGLPYSSQLECVSHSIRRIIRVYRELGILESWQSRDACYKFSKFLVLWLDESVCGSQGREQKMFVTRRAGSKEFEVDRHE